MRLVLILLSLCLTVACSSPGATPPAASVTIPVLTTGKMINIEDHLAEGSFTVFDFYADWCPPCIKLSKSLKDMKGVYGDRLTIYKLDIVEWESELAQGYNIRDLPHLAVYRPDGTLLDKGQSNSVLPKLISALNE